MKIEKIVVQESPDAPTLKGDKYAKFGHGRFQLRLAQYSRRLDFGFGFNVEEGYFSVSIFILLWFAAVDFMYDRNYDKSDQVEHTEHMNQREQIEHCERMHVEMARREDLQAERQIWFTTVQNLLAEDKTPTQACGMADIILEEYKKRFQ